MKRNLAKTAVAVQASTTMAIDSLYKKMMADGLDVVGFGAGEPDFNTPEDVKQKAKESIDNNVTRYTPPAGMETLRKAICARIGEDCGVGYDPSQVVVSSGAKHNLYLAFKALLDPGDEVILPAPYWVSYYEQIQMAGGTPVVIATDESESFKLSGDALGKAVTPRTKALVLNNPSNPTGQVYTRAQLEELAAVCVKNGIYVISDEIYYRLIYGDTQFTSFAALGPEVQDLTILINGVSKSYAMTGWRIGYACAAKEVATVMANYQSHSTSAPCSIAQAAAIQALNGPQDSIEQMRRRFEQRRDLFLAKAASIPGVRCVKPDGAFYIMMDVSAWLGKTLHGKMIATVNDFAQHLLEKSMVAVVPCDGFGAPSYLRWSYAVSEAVIEKGLARLAAFLV